MKPVVTKAELKVLERAFSAEIEQRLPFQTKSKLAAKLTTQGYLATMTDTIGSGPFAVTVTGYALTHLGRMTYCATCEEV